MHGLCRALVEIGHKVSVFTTNVDGPHDTAVPLGQPVDLDGVQVWYFSSKRLRRLYWAPVLMHALREHITQFDIVHLHSVFLWPTWAAARAARKAGVPYLIAPRGMLVRDLIRRKSRWLKCAWIALIERCNIERAAGIHVTAPLEQQEIEKFGFNLPPFFYVPNGIDEVDAAALEGAKSDMVPDMPYVLFLSRINWKKGLDRLVKAWALVPDMQLVIAGNDEENYRAEIEGLAQTAGVAERIHFVGPVHGNDKRLLYRHAELFVLPSYSENFGIVVLEAMAMGCPVLVTPEVGLAAVVAEVGCGRVVDGETGALAATINSLLSDRDLRKAMGSRGRETARNRFLWGSVVRQMEDVYRQVLAQAGATL